MSLSMLSRILKPYPSNASALVRTIMAQIIHIQYHTIRYTYNN